MSFSIKLFNSFNFIFCLFDWNRSHHRLYKIGYLYFDYDYCALFVVCIYERLN